jgi:ubiquitin-conjugating enzyme E2 G1
MAQKRVAQVMLLRWFRQLQESPSDYFSCGLIDDNPFKWRCSIIGPTATPYAGGIFPTELVFPDNFPNSPPAMRFLYPMWHPNIEHPSGRVCISILHPPGTDPFNPAESASERWLPIHTVESIIVSVLSGLSDPNLASPWNIDAARDYRTDQKTYLRKVRRCTQESLRYC